MSQRCSYVLWDELPFAVDAGVGSLASDLLLLFRNATGRRRRPTGVQGPWSDGKGEQNEKLSGEGEEEEEGEMMKR